jgi:hypothetical protein
MDLYFQGQAQLNMGATPQNLALARGFFERALAFDPSNIEALVGTAREIIFSVAQYLADDRGKPSAGAAARPIYAFTAFRIVTDAGGVIHLDIKKLGRIGSVGHRITGRYPGAINRHRSIGWEFVHVCIDDASRVAFVQVLADQRKESAVAFLQAAVAYYAKLGIRIERVPPVLMRTTWIACSRSFAPPMAAALGHRARTIGSDASRRRGSKRWRRRSGLRRVSSAAHGT